MLSSCCHGGLFTETCLGWRYATEWRPISPPLPWSWVPPCFAWPLFLFLTKALVETTHLWRTGVRHCRGCEWFAVSAHRIDIKRYKECALVNCIASPSGVDTLSVSARPCCSEAPLRAPDSSPAPGTLPHRCVPSPSPSPRSPSSRVLSLLQPIARAPSPPSHCMRVSRIARCLSHCRCVGSRAAPQ